MRFRALSWHREVGQALLVHERETLRALLHKEAGALGETRRHRAALVGEICTHVRIERVAIDHGVVQQTARQVPADGSAAAIITIRNMLGDERPQPLFDASRGFIRRPGRWTTDGCQHTREHAPLYVIERVVQMLRAFTAVVDVTLLVSGDTHQHAEIKQSAADRYKLAPFMVNMQCKLKAERRESRFVRKGQKALAQNLKRYLRIGALKHSTR